ncbi:hypothetical protein ACHAW6_014825, partial [Cyclotella cf. meneghiniana]
MKEHTTTHELLLCYDGVPSHLLMLQSHRQRLLLRVEWTDIRESMPLHKTIGIQSDGSFGSNTKASDPPNLQPTNPLVAPPQTPLNNKTNMVFMTIVDIEGKLFTDQTGPFLVTANRGNNYIIIFDT